MVLPICDEYLTFLTKSRKIWLHAHHVLLTSDIKHIRNVIFERYLYDNTIFAFNLN